MGFTGGARGNKFFVMNKNVNTNTVVFGAVATHAFSGGQTQGALLTTGGQANIPMPSVVTTSLMSISMTNNTIDADTISRLRLEIGTFGTQIITIPSLSGAVTLQDTSNSDIIPALNLPFWEHNTTSTGTVGSHARLATSMRCSL